MGYLHRGAQLLIAVCLTLPLQAQSITPVGADATLDVATWNIEWFGHPSLGPSDDERQLANVRAVIEQSQIDLWALQEVDRPDQFLRLLDSLGSGFGGFYRDNTSGGVTQRLAYVYRSDVITAGRIEQMFAGQYDYEYASRPPLRLEATVSLPDTTLSVMFITLHMKCCGDVTSHERRRDAALRLKNRLDFLYPNTRIIILGDFNDELGGSITFGRSSPYVNFLQDESNYRFLTLPLDQANVPTYCGNNTSCTSGSTLDHILITNELFDAHIESTTDRYADLLNSFDGTGGACGGEFVCTTSDHLPVYARFEFKSTTSTEDSPLPAGFSIGAPFPNPFLSIASLPFTLDRPAEVRIEVYDLLGRSVTLVERGLYSAGTHEAMLNARDLTPGVYVVRYSIGKQIAVRLITHFGGYN